MPHRYFTSDISGDAARICGPDAAHLGRVLRAKPGQRLCLCDGAGSDYEAEIVCVSPEEVTLRVLGKAPSSAEPSLRAEVYLGVAKGERMDFAVQKCVELGAAFIQPFVSENTVAKPKDGGEKARRWARIATEAAKQAGRGLLPEAAPPLPFAGALARAAKCELALFFHERGGLPLRRALGGKAPASVAILTGPEGGFTPEEARQAEAAGCVPVCLGPRILRCETAPLAALTAVMLLSGNLE